MIENIILSVLLITAPVSLYLLYTIYAHNFKKEINDLILDVTLLSCFYFVIRFNSLGNHYLALLLFNIPFLIAILKKRKLVSVLLSVAIIVYYSNIIENITNILLVEYLSYYVLYFVLMRKGFSTQFLLNSYILIKVFFLSVIYFNTAGYLPILTFVNLWVYAVIFYVLCYLFIMLLEAGEKAIKLHTTLTELLKDNLVRSSLFKISHEIKNPMTVCKGYISMLNPEDPKKCEKYLKVIDEEIDRALLILDDFLIFNKVNVKRQKMDLNELIDDVKTTYEMLLPCNRICFETKIVTGKFYIKGDYERIKQVLINLIKNSVEAIPEQTEGSITLKTEVKNNFYVTSITDNGVGMDTHTINNIFEPFYTSKKNGTGLGASLSKEIVDLHAGKLDYKSKLGKGTKVVLKLPLLKE